MSSPPVKPALRARYEQRRQHVVATAAQRFALHGYQATSIDDLSAATGLTVGGLYHYIGSKELLLVRICDDLMDPLLAEAAAIDTGSGPDAHLRALVRAWVNHVVVHRDHLIVFQQERQVLEQDTHWSDVRDKRKQFELILDGVLMAGQKDGTMTFTDRGLALYSLLAMVNYLPQWFRPDGRLSTDDVADGFCDLILGS